MLLALFTSIGAWADVTMPTLTTDPSNPVYYTIKNFRSDKYASYAGPSTQLAQISDANYRTLWYFVENGEGVSIVPAADPTVKLATNSSATADGAVWYIKENPYNSGYFCISLKSDLSNNCWDDNAAHTGIGYWRPKSDDYKGTSWVIEASSVTFETRKAAITSVIERLPDVLKPAAKMTAYTNATTDAQLISAVADFSANVTFKCRSNNYLVVGNSKGAHVASPSNNEEIIQLVSVGDGSFFLKGYMSCKYMADVARSTAIQTEANANTPYYIQALGDYAVARPTKYADTGGDPNYEGFHYIHNGGSEGSGGCVGWETGADNSQYTIEEVTLPDGYVTVTYNVELDGNIVATETLRQASGNAAVVPSALQRDFVTYSYDPATIPANDATITATATVSGLPFTVSTDYANANWYYLHGHATHNDTYISTNGSATVWGTGKTATDAYKWAFIGNPITGIKVINKASGNGSYLMATNPATMGSTAKAWTLKQQTNTGWNSGANGFGLYDATRKYLNTQDATLKYWSYFDQGSTFWVQEIPEVTVTFNLEVNSEVVNTIELNVPEGETVSVPAALTANYSPLAYDITGTEDVPVGESDMTVTVTATLKAGIVTDLSGLSNDKAYRLVTERGTFTTDNGELANTAKSGSNYTIYNFAIVQHESKYYLWSVQDGKFVAGSGTALTETPTAVTLNKLTGPLFKFQCGTNYLNCNSNGCSFGNYSTTDAGNTVALFEAADFDPTPVIEALTNLAPSVVANIKPFFDAAGSDLFQLKASVAEANSATYTAALTNCNVATYDALLAVVSDADNFNLPETGKFYLVKNNYNGKYMRVTASGVGNVKADLTAEEAVKDASAYFTFVENNSHLYMSTQGVYLNWVWGTSDGYEAQISVNPDKYVHFAVPAPGVGAFSIAYGNGVDGFAGYLGAGFYALKNTETKVVAGSPTNQTHATAQWTFEEVSTLNITLNGPVGDNYYATLCVPFDITLAGATAYTLALNGSETALTMTEVEGNVDAGTPVLLKGTSASATATISPAASTTISTETALTGTYFAKSVTGTTDFFLGKSEESKIGFYHWAGSTLAANRAYFEASKRGGSNVKGFELILDDEATGISAIENEKSEAEGFIYNLAGQRLQKMQKGINIVNGKKVMVK